MFPKRTSVSLRRYSVLDMGSSIPPRYDLRGSPRADYRDLYRGMRRLATAQAKPRILLFLSPLMIKARVRGLRSTQRAIFFLFKTSPARLLDLVR